MTRNVYIKTHIRTAIYTATLPLITLKYIRLQLSNVQLATVSGGLACFRSFSFNGELSFTSFLPSFLPGIFSSFLYTSKILTFLCLLIFNRNVYIKGFSAVTR